MTSISGILRAITSRISHIITNKINDVTKLEIGYLSGVKGNIQEQLLALQQKKKRFGRNCGFGR